MANDGLCKVWSLDPCKRVSNPHPCPGIDALIINDLLVNRWSANNVAHVLNIVPSSEERLRNEGLGALYRYTQGLEQRLRDVAQKKGISVPPYPDIPQDWQEEVKNDCQTLNKNLLPHFADPMKDYVRYATETLTSGKHHWSSLVAPMSVASDALLISMARIEAEGEGNLGTYAKAAMGDETMILYKEAMVGNELEAYARVLREEILRIREGPEWNDEEARTISTEHLNQLKQFFDV